MAYRAIVIRVMIASPGDVQEERKIIREVLQKWNDIHSIGKKLVFLPVGWETHMAPQSGGTPQELINKKILKDCDLLIGVFWTRIGSPTVKAISGTVEEVEFHIASGKPAMVYFSEMPVKPGSYAPEQFEKVEKFKAGLTDVLWAKYISHEEFEKNLTDHLNLILFQSEYLMNLINDANIEPEHEVEEDELSEEEEELLKAASESKTGTIFYINDMGGHHIQAGEKVFSFKSWRERSEWDHALKQLYSMGFLDMIGENFYKLNKSGWDLSDKI
ncbi:DUF4062 domain-containing protein [Myxococcota bacterium]|nr:DUF4062 domain-containing protein [Myxococcota bacterium]MBU1382881.1 DUF4062 domain-containing protein [Myxococcota bacterium]MBU1496687.1 DUF4062 domain-containing protein [Myxococcota bacterium]